MINDLIRLYQNWVVDNNVRTMSADELLAEHYAGVVKLTDKQFNFLTHFIAIWEEV